MSKRKILGDDFLPKKLDGFKMRESELLNPKLKKSNIIGFLPLPPLSESQ